MPFRAKRVEKTAKTEIMGITVGFAKAGNEKRRLPALEREES